MATPSEVESLFTPSVLASLGSFFVAAAALVLALSARSVARRRERSALYLDLKARFANVYKDLAHIYKQTSLPEDEEDQYLISLMGSKVMRQTGCRRFDIQLGKKGWNRGTV
jgi:hypothetical protein